MNCRMKRAWYEHESVPQTGVSCVLEEKRVKIFLFFLVTNENEENRALMKVVSCSTEKRRKKCGKHTKNIFNVC